MADNWMLGETAALDDYIPTPPSNMLGNAAQGVKDWWSNQPSWLDRAQAENQRTAEAYQRGGMGEIARQLATDTTEAQDLASGFGGNIKGVKPPLAPGALAAVSEYRPPFYSAVEQAVQGAKQNAAPGQQWAGFLRNQPGVKPEEVQALGLGKLFEQPGSVPKEAVLGEIAANRVNVGEVVKGSGRNPEAVQRAKEAKEKFAEFARPLAEKYGINEEHNLAMYSSLKKMDPTEVANYEVLQRNWMAAERAVDKPETKFGSYTLPGGENYREMLLTLPQQQGPKWQLWQDEIARLRNKYGENFYGPNSKLTQQEKQNLEQLHRGAGHGAGDPGLNFQSSHYDEPNVLAHVRYNDRVIDGKKTLFVEEVQSDWHQKGKREGYIQPAGNKEPLADWLQRTGKPDTPQSIAEYKRETGFGATVPDAPFKTTWPELAMKRIIREAAEKGYDKVAWTPGSVQAERYDLSRHIEKVRAVKNDDGTFQLVATPKNGTAIMLGGGRLPADEMADHIGKDLAEKIVKDIEAKSGNNWGVKNKQSGNWSQRFASKEEAEAFQQSLPETTRKQTDVLAMAPKYSTEYSGLDLQVGGEGMKGFYDEILPATVNRLVKKHGGRVEQAEMREHSPAELARMKPYQREFGKHAVHSLDITPSLRAAAMKGFPLFTAGGVAATGIMGEMARQDEYR